MVGAALLAGRAALRLGAGKVFVQCLGAPALVFDPLQPELMLRTSEQLSGLDAQVDVLVVGCGLGTDATALACVGRALDHAGAVVLDADALNLLATEPELQRQLAARTAATTVLTPHPGEAARLLGLPTRTLQLDRVRHARFLAEKFGSLVVLKGAGSIIAVPPAHGNRYVINPTGSAALASAGTGDVLAGMIGALLAQAARAKAGTTLAAPAASLQAVLAAVWLHGQRPPTLGPALA
jgi:ADP-dependent NAD(P)H-hydrate dehydratase / NAD(P)H-hydrate epimerase